MTIDDLDTKETRSEPTNTEGVARNTRFPTSQTSDLTDSVLLPADSDTDPVLSVVLPTLNEEEGIAECIRRIESALHELDIKGEVIVSDASTDRTPEIARSMGAIVVEPDEPGYGYAYQYAFDHCRGDYIAMGDADTTYDFEELPKLFTHVAEGDADIAMGSRLNGEIKPGAMPALHRYIGNPLLTKFLNAFYDTGISDAHSGMRVFTRETLDELKLETTGMEFASEMVMEAGACGLEIAEEPITYHERTGEATLDSFRDGWRHVRFMLVNAPTYLFTAPAVAFIGVGVLIMLLSVLKLTIGGVTFGTHTVTIGGVTFGTHTVIAGSLMTLVGCQVGCLSVCSAIAADPIKTPSDPVISWVSDNFRLEHGILIGAGFIIAGGLYVSTIVGQWVASGYTKLPFVEWNMVAFTVIVLGVQFVFQSFFLSLID